jgi:ankyrin repeat protein
MNRSKQPDVFPLNGIPDRIHLLRILAYWVVAIIGTSSGALQASESIRFIPATPENTTMLDGSPVNTKGGDWLWLPEKGNRGVFESVPDQQRKTATVMVNAAGLEAGAAYEVFGYFWAGNQAPDNHAVQIGLSLATMHPFDGERTDDLVAKEPWVITPGYKTGQAYGYQAVVEDDNPLPGLFNIITTQGNSRLIRARLGYSRAGKDGTLPVFFSPNHGSRSVGSAMVDGIALHRAAPDVSPDQGRKPGTRLHLAIRAGDPITIQRELEAEADVNAFDEENLTPLFYAAACGNAALVRTLLGHGAHPNQAAQSVSPLTAAATISDTEIVQLLLDSGAEVPSNLPKDKGKLAINIDPRILHPVVAAIRSGSVPVLNMLLSANKDLSLPKFEEELRSRAASSNPKLPSIYLTGDSMLRRNWDMAAYLIDIGASITCSAYSGYTYPQGLMLADAVHAWPDSRPVLEAMLRRGEPAVTKAKFRSDDALNIAALHGNEELVLRFLPHADHVETYYQNGLLENALSSENKEVIAMVRNKFPDAKVPRWQPATKSEATPALEEPAKRWFLPRTSPPPQVGQKKAEQKRVLAVMAEPDAKGAGDMITVHASMSDSWLVVDREQIEATLAEGRFSKPWRDGEHRLSDLGDQLKADCLIVITAIRVGKETIHRFEVVDVATGMEIHREHFKSDAFVDKQEVAGFLERAALALDAAGSNQYHQAVTLLSFSAQGRIGNPHAITGLLRAAVQHQVDSTPGLISLSRAQSARLIEEQALGGKNSVWGAAHMIEGVIAANGESDIKVTLRLETIKDAGVTIKTDAEAIGKSTAVVETAIAAWKKLMEASGNQIAVAAAQPDDNNRALSEGKRLMREADWLHAIHADPSSYLPLIESAIALGVPAEESILLDLDARFREFMFLYPKNSDALPDRNHEHTTTLQHIPDILHPPASLARSDQLAYKVPSARAFLHQTSWYLDRLGRDGLLGGTDVWQVYDAYKSNEIWYAIQALCSIRALIYTESVPDELRSEHKVFCSELDDLIHRYFSILRSVPDPDPYRYYLATCDVRIFRKNPVLVEELVGMVSAGASPMIVLPRSSSFGLIPTKLDLARKIIASIGDSQDHRLKLIKADLECYVADRQQRESAIRRLIEVSGETRWQIAPSRHEGSQRLVCQEIIHTSTTHYLFESVENGGMLQHNGSLLPSLLFSKRPGPDTRIRFAMYHNAVNGIARGMIWQKNANATHIDSFRKSILAYDQWEITRLEAEQWKQAKVSGPPGEKTLSHGPPGFGVGAKLESEKLYSLIKGAGKIQSKSVNPIKASDSKRGQPALSATLLTDLRIGGSPGTIIWPLVDKVDSNLLWVFHFSSVGDAICINQARGDGALNVASLYDERIVYHAPWLYGIDCREGSMVRKINLHAAVGEAYGLDLANRKCDVWRMALDQTNNRILTSVGWHDQNYSGNKVGSVILDKKTGKAHPIPRNPQISEGEGNVPLDLWDRNNGVAAVGDHFFYLDKAGEWTGGAIQGVRSSELAVFQVFPDLSVKPLTMMGRRPELTPFDAQNRSTRMATGSW